MKFLEKNLEDIICETSNEKLQERGLLIDGKKFRQVKLSHYGVADIISVKRYGQSLHIDLIELKKDSISVDALIQSLRYVEGIRHYLRKRSFNRKVFFTIKLCGNTVFNLKELSLLCSYITGNHKNVEFVDLYTYNYTMEGIFFEEQYSHIIDDRADCFNRVTFKNKDEKFDLF
jgi:hypothetical protein